MYHTCAYEGSQALSTNQQTIPAAADSILKIGSANGFVLQEDMMLLCAYAAGVGIRHAGFKSPKLNQFNPLQITPDQLTLPVVDGLIQAQWYHRPFVFRNQEEVTVVADNTNAGAQQQDVIAFFSNGVEPIPPGEILTIRGTSTTAAVANAWTLLTFTLDQTLPEGLYTLCSSECVSTNAIAHRWTFWQQFYRPGHLSNAAFENRQSPFLYNFQLGAMGNFSNVTLPNLEVFCSGTDNSHTFIMRAIKIK